MIGLGALEARQERVVDVDAAAHQLLREVVGEDLHVAGEHDRLAVGLLHDLPDLSLLLDLGFRLDRQVMEGGPLEIEVGVGRARVVGDDARDVHDELARSPVVEDVGQAVVELGDHQQHLLPLVRVSDRPVHVKGLGDGREAVAHRLDRAVAGEVEDDPHEEAGRLGVVELMRFEDVATALEEVGRDRRHEAGAVRADHLENVALVRHRRDPGRGWWTALGEAGGPCGWF